jgi:hypothetical protein
MRGHFGIAYDIFVEKNLGNKTTSVHCYGFCIWPKRSKGILAQLGQIQQTHLPPKFDAHGKLAH